MKQAELPQVNLRKIGSVQVFDLSGVLAGAEVDLVAQKIDQVIQRKKLRRVILNLQKVQSIDEISLRKIISCLIRPQRSLLFVPNGGCRELIETTHLPANVRICKNEEEVAEAFGSFLFLKDKIFQVPVDETQPAPKNYGLERRRNKRIRVAIPVRLVFQMKDGSALAVKAIATNVSQGGLFAEFLDLDAPSYSKMQGLEQMQVTITVPPNDTFKDEVTIPGKIARFELLKKQYGIAIQFL
ncbi:MAG: STAS domain-containing protein [Candidatus Omnitrophica bacterium]|nr:STAS domain-containing protein [Candidatus Omnitrophota bacterium]